MSKIIAGMLKSIANLLYKISIKIEFRSTSRDPAAESVRARNIKRWFEDNGDKTHRLNYNLNDDSVVFDLGGYEGEWAAQILCLYGPYIYIFEPYADYFRNIEDKFRHNKKIRTFQFGLSSDNQLAKLAIADNSSSIFIAGDHSVDISLIRTSDFFDQHSISKVDLMKINIEGGEYDLLEHMIEAGIISRIVNIQVQFHDFIPGAAERAGAIQQALSKTHELTYQYEFVWENWRLRTL